MQKIFIIILANLIFYFKTLRYGYVSDDLAQVIEKPKTRKLYHYFQQLRCREYYNSEFSHLLNILTHILVCMGIYLAFGKNNISFMAALLFAFNPITQQAGVWLSGRFYAITALVVLACWGFKILFPFLYPFSLYLSLASIPLPLVYLGTEYWFYIFGFLMLAVLFTKSKKFIHTFKARKLLINCNHKKINLGKVIISIKTFTYVFLHCLFPRRIGMYHTFLFSYGNTDEDIRKGNKLDRWFWGGLALIGIILFAIITNFKDARFGLWWFCVFISPLTNLYMINQPIADRYYYIPSIGLMLALINFIGANITIFVIFLTYYITRGWLSLGSYKDDDLFTEYNLYDINHPDQHFAYILKGEKERKLGRPFQALETWVRGVKAKPSDIRLHIYIAKTLGEMGFYKEALYHIEEAKKTKMYDIDIGITTLIDPLENMIKKRQELKNEFTRQGLERRYNIPKPEGLNVS